MKKTLRSDLSLKRMNTSRIKFWKKNISIILKENYQPKLQVQISNGGLERMLQKKSIRKNKEIRRLANKELLRRKLIQVASFNFSMTLGQLTQKLRRSKEKMKLNHNIYWVKIS